ncbi:hypothetical protein CHS0354_006760 [Potamilus streckersoni]|uniref:Myosin motor domain-containing protein n=1 Tax=Potamilus streckersoni TaxID=2493646 RepID=A0AAE0S851_9BIVA|nr:hypothetical protein CHS0354_006760 [Potamilus streckersoni]
MWRDVIIMSIQKHHCIVKSQDGMCCEVPVENVFLQPECDLTTVNNLTRLTPLHQTSVLSCLEQRYIAGQYYTRAGNSLIAVNPFCDCQHLYNPDKVESYHQQTEVEPHIYQVGEEAYRCLVGQLGKVNQSIIVSGESGAGKTVSARHLVQYVTLVSSPGTIRCEDWKGEEIERRILQSNLILEAFGNSVTQRNDNSSRFGKYIHLQFSRQGQLQGANILTYLLEKTRVVHQGPRECNFHIFYQLLQGIDDWPVPNAISKELKNAHFKITPPATGPVHENLCLGQTLKAMSEIGLPVDFQQNIFQVLSAILFLGNIEFCPLEDEICKLLEDEVTEMAMRIAADLLSVETCNLEQMFLYRSIQPGGHARHSVFVKPVPQSEAKSRCDCLATLLYTRLFDWLVSFINNQIQASSYDHTIGLLDIYGFESFHINSLEQLCINYANEKLQQHFVRHFLKDLQKEYEEECVEWSHINYTDNQPCLDLLEGQASVFGLLNEEVYLNRKSDSERLGERILSLATTHKCLTKCRQNISEQSFTVRHYAGDVTYSVDGLVTKNKDNIPVELVAMLQNSTNPFVSGLFKDYQTEDNSGMTKKKKTVLAKFKSSLDYLLASLNTSDVHYIRCIKPNPLKQAAVFDRQYVMRQLVANGITEAVEISKHSFPVRLLYTDFLKRYGLIIRHHQDSKLAETHEGEYGQDETMLFDPLDMLYKKQLDMPSAPHRTPTPRKRRRRRTGLTSADHTRKCCAAVLRIVLDEVIEADTVRKQFGKTTLFLHQHQLENLDSARAKIMVTQVIKIQGAWRRYRQWKERLRRNLAAVKIQMFWRRWTNRRKQAAVLLIQKSVRMFLTRRKFLMKQVETAKHKSSELKEKSRDVMAWITPAEALHEITNLVVVAGPDDQVMGTEQICHDDKPVERKENHLPQCNINDTGAIQHLQERLSRQTIREKRSDKRKCYWKADPNEPLLKRLRSACSQYSHLNNINIAEGILTHRRLPKVPLRFHTRSSVLKNAHVVHQKETRCGLNDCLSDSSP